MHYFYILLIYPAISMRLRVLWIFQRRLVIPAAIIFAALAVYFRQNYGPMPAVRTAAVVYVMVAALLHYFLYDVKSPRDYYFYNNFGWSKKSLWVITLGVGLGVYLISMIVCTIFFMPIA